MESREIELLGVKVVAPEHPRFMCDCCGQWCFDRESLTALVANNEDAVDFAILESSCCIAIVWWESEAVRLRRERIRQMESDKDKLIATLRVLGIEFIEREPTDCLQGDDRELTAIRINEGMGWGGFFVEFYFLKDTGKFAGHGVWE